MLALLIPQTQGWDKYHQELIKDHALTELVNSEDPEGERRILRYTEADESAKTIPLGSMVGAAKFVDDAALKTYSAAFEALTKELPITLQTTPSSTRKALMAMQESLTGEACPLIDAGAIFVFDRLLEEIVKSLSTATTA